MIKFLRCGLAAAVLSTAAIPLAPAVGQAAPQLLKAGFDLPLIEGATLLLVRKGRGADDGAGHDAGDDKVGRKAGKGRGADDAQGDDRGGRMGGKGRGADDAPGDDRGGKGGKGRGRDDGPNHT